MENAMSEAPRVQEKIELIFESHKYDHKDVIPEDADIETWEADFEEVSVPAL